VCLTSLLKPGGGVQCILVNERGAEQRMAPLLERRGIVVVKLLDQVREGAFIPFLVSMRSLFGHSFA